MINLYGLHVSKYTSPMDAMGVESQYYIVGLYLPIVGIPYFFWQDDHSSYSDFWPWHIWEGSYQFLKNWNLPEIDA